MKTNGISGIRGWMGALALATALGSGTAAAGEAPSLYSRLGGYDAIAAVVEDLVQRLAADPQLGRFWAHRGEDGIRREKQLVVGFIVAKAGGPLHYAGRELAPSHQGMRIGDKDWQSFMQHLHATLAKFRVPEREQADVVAFMESTRGDLVGR